MDKQDRFPITEALNDFYQARRRAVIRDILAELRGQEKDLLSFDEVRQRLRTQGSLQRGLQDIPLTSIVGSVNRYEDFTRDFLPRGNVSAQRWAKVEVLNDGSVGLPPIEVYQLGEIYFVIDGNHRVSVARLVGAVSIQAYVYEVPTQVSITPDDSFEQILIKAEYAQFLENTGLLELRPEADLTVTVPGQTRVLEEHIDVHRYFMGLDFKRDIPYAEAVTHWYDTVYQPVVQVIQRQGLQRDFPNRTQADLYLWIAEHRAELENSQETSIQTDMAAGSLAQQYSPRLEHFAGRLGERLKDVFLPDTLETGPATGEWRKHKLNQRQSGCLFSDILVPLNGSPAGWFALEQALLIAGREQARLQGLHVVPRKEDKKRPETLAVKETFEQRCSETEISGKLVVASGGVARQIVERSRWYDLVVVNLSFPPSTSQFSKLGSGFRNLVLRCPRPILAVPETVSPLESALLAYDGSPKSEEALFVATFLTGKWGIPLTVLSVFNSTEAAAPVLEKAANYLSEYQVEAKFVVKSGSISEAILSTAEENSIDFIIMGGYGDPPLVNFLLDNVLDQVLRASRKPMLLCR